MLINILKNPFFIAIIVAVITYLYLYWKNKKKEVPGSVSLIPPIIAGFIAWFIAAYFNKSKKSTTTENMIKSINDTKTKYNLRNYDVVNDLNINDNDNENLNKNKNEHFNENDNFNENNNFNENENENENDNENKNQYISRYQNNSSNFLGKGNIKIPDEEVFIDIGRF